MPRPGPVRPGVGYLREASDLAEGPESTDGASTERRRGMQSRSDSEHLLGMMDEPLQKEQIRELLYSYCRAVDQRDPSTTEFRLFRSGGTLSW
jgi:hypothetical protein